MKIASRFIKTGTEYRISKYCVDYRVDDGVLLFNVLTRELLLLTSSEYDNLDKMDYLKKQLFMIPTNTDEKSIASVCKSFVLSQRKDLSTITGYTIFPTTDCNARCFYCFEKGRSVSSMSENMAQSVVEFIKRHCANKKVTFRWFGGEPLMNPKAIDIICSGLRDAGIEYVSNMVSNGYLFTDELIEKASSLWNLSAVQITLDGTEDVYNRVKAYVNSSGSAYERVISNIEKLTKASIRVFIRMNMDLYNAADLLDLSKHLAVRFSGNQFIRSYPHHIFKEGVPMGEMHSDAEWEKRDFAIAQIEKVLVDAGIYKVKSLSVNPRTAHCMADSGSAITILPDGHIGLCEHYSESEFIGHVDSDEFDKSVISRWRELVDEIPECNDCFFYPDCVMLKKCTNSTVCYPQLRASHLRKTKAKMHQLYEQWKSK